MCTGIHSTHISKYDKWRQTCSTLSLKPKISRDDILVLSSFLCYQHMLQRLNMGNFTPPLRSHRPCSSIGRAARRIMDNASDLGSGYCGFESRRASGAGSSPVMAKHFATFLGANVLILWWSEYYDNWEAPQVQARLSWWLVTNKLHTMWPCGHLATSLL